jgi:hypothetical protein
MYKIQNKPQVEQTSDPSMYPQRSFKDKSCRSCGKTFSPKAPSHHYCSQECADDGLTTAYLKRTYGITSTDYKTMLEAQDHKCGVCGSEGFTMKKEHKVKLVVDHDHETGEVRGLLCHNCNRALGLFHDDPEALMKAIKWVTKKHSTVFADTTDDVFG